MRVWRLFTMSSRFFLPVFAFSIIFPTAALGWGEKGHLATVAVALDANPFLESRLRAVLRHLPESMELRTMIAEDRKRATTPQLRQELNHSIAKARNPIYWNYLPNAGYWPDVIRGFKSYKRLGYDDHHYINLVYGASGNQDHIFKRSPNAVEQLEIYMRTLRNPSKTRGQRAWAAAWILHLVGDLHQPLHTTARNLRGGSQERNLDHGGGAVMYDGRSLHSFWDNLPNQSPPMPQYISILRNRFAGNANLPILANELDPKKWCYEGTRIIYAIGYPSDAPWRLGAVGKRGLVPRENAKNSAYNDKARQIADRQIYLGGLRLAKILDKHLPPSP